LRIGIGTDRTGSEEVSKLWPGVRIGIIGGGVYGGIRLGDFGSSSFVGIWH